MEKGKESPPLSGRGRGDPAPGNAAAKAKDKGNISATKGNIDILGDIQGLVSGVRRD